MPLTLQHVTSPLIRGHSCTYQLNTLRALPSSDIPARLPELHSTESLGAHTPSQARYQFSRCVWSPAQQTSTHQSGSVNTPTSNCRELATGNYQRLATSDAQLASLSRSSQWHRLPPTVTLLSTCDALKGCCTPIDLLM